MTGQKEKRQHRFVDLVRVKRHPRTVPVLFDLRRGLRRMRTLQREATPSRYVFTTKPGLTHEGLRSYAWVHFRRDCGSRTLLNPAKDETSEPPVDLRRDKTGLSVSPGSKPQQLSWTGCARLRGPGMVKGLPS